MCHDSRLQRDPSNQCYRLQIKLTTDCIILAFVQDSMHSRVCGGKGVGESSLWGPEAQCHVHGNETAMHMAMKLNHRRYVHTKHLLSPSMSCLQSMSGYKSRSTKYSMSIAATHTHNHAAMHAHFTLWSSFYKL